MGNKCIVFLSVIILCLSVSGCKTVPSADNKRDTQTVYSQTFESDVSSDTCHSESKKTVFADKTEAADADSSVPSGAEKDISRAVPKTELQPNYNSSGDGITLPDDEW